MSVLLRSKISITQSGEAGATILRNFGAGPGNMCCAGGFFKFTGGGICRIFTMLSARESGVMDEEHSMDVTSCQCVQRGKHPEREEQENCRFFHIVVL